MSKSDLLFQLIQAMSKSEKRSFKLYSLLQSGNKEYMRLFDAIVKQKEYDESKLKKVLKIKGFSVVKNYLYNQILRSMRMNHEEHGINSIIRSYIQNTEILIEKGLFKHAWKSLNKAKELSKSYEKNTMQMEIYMLENILISQSYVIKQYEQYLEKNIKDIQQAVAQFENLVECRTINFQLYYQNIKKGELVRNKKEEKINRRIVGRLLAEGPQMAISYKAKISYYNVIGSFYQKLGDYESAYKVNKALIKHLQSQPHIFKEEQLSYITSMNNLMNVQGKLKKYDEVKETVDQLRLLKTSSEYNRLKILELCAPIEVNYYIKTKKIKEGVKRIPEIVKQNELYEEKWNRYFEIIFFINVSEFYYYADDLSKSLYWNNKVMNHEKIKNYEQLFNSTKMNSMLIQYEMGNEDLVESIIRSNEKHFRINKDRYGIENCIIRLFKDLVNSDDKKQQLTILQKFRAEFQNLFKSFHKNENLAYFDFISWADKRISELSDKK